MFYMQMGIFLTVVLTTAVSAELSDKTCNIGQQNSINSACDWQCKLHQHLSGTCMDHMCQCDGKMDSESVEKLFDRAENNDTLSGLPYFLKNVIFLPLTRTYIFRSRSDLLTPQYYGLDNAENFYIPTANGGVLGSWYIWPEHSDGNIKHLSRNETLVVYMHGNSLDRGFFYRIGLYKMLISLGYHVLAFDYRSYGDSTRVALSESTTLEDGQAVLSWLYNMLDIKSKDTPNIILWGHSLGTSIATRTLASSDAKISAMVNGLILESPFNNMFDELHHFNTVTWSAWLLGIDIAETLQIADAEFRTEDYLGNITVPVLMLHAEDDRIVPSTLSEKMLQTANNNYKSLDIELILFPSELNLRHKYIYRAPGIQNIITSFTKKVR